MSHLSKWVRHCKLIKPKTKLGVSYSSSFVLTLCLSPNATSYKSTPKVYFFYPTPMFCEVVILLNVYLKCEILVKV